MTKFFFWNINRQPVAQEVATLCGRKDVDIVILAESTFPDSTLQIKLKQITGRSYITLFNELSQRLRFFFRYPPESIVPVSDSYGLSIREIRPPLGKAILLAAVHLSSKLRNDYDEQAAQARNIIQLIEEAEKRGNHSRTIVMGDFNMNPFEGGMVDADSFHGVMSQEIAQENKRIVRRIERKFFYNPMWSRMGDNSLGPPGTYYYSASKNREFFWNTFDQVLLRPDLLSTFNEGDLEVITVIKDKELLSKNKPNRTFSDHLPILLDMPIELQEMG